MKKILCNNCGKELKTKNEQLMEDALEVTKEWGYFSKKDLQVHSFKLCETCYDQIVSNFQVPVTVREKNEAI